MDGPGERLCVGEPDRLSLDDWWKPEEKLRELCMGGGGGCLDSFFRMLRRRLCEEKTAFTFIFTDRISRLFHKRAGNSPNYTTTYEYRISVLKRYRQYFCLSSDYYKKEAHGAAA